jgi:aminotransferase in exopolysaccharide biosynthesis
MMEMFTEEFIAFARDIYGEDSIPLHRPVFNGSERQKLVDCIDSNFVSSVGKQVNEFETKVGKFVGAEYAVATVNGTAALHTALVLSDVRAGDEVITQALTFVATCNSIRYCGAHPVFVDVDKDTMGMSPSALKNFFETHVEVKGGQSFNRTSGRRIVACLPMHTFGFPCRIEAIAKLCDEWGIALVEDSAESLGSYINGRHTGTFGSIGVFSFNGNKVITTGGGGMLVTDNPDLAKRAKHITTTAKLAHPYEFVHDQVAYNYRMPNLNAALGCAQMEQIQEFLEAKLIIFKQWGRFFAGRNIQITDAIEGAEANYWLNAIVLNSKKDRDRFLRRTNDAGVMTRPVWRLMSELTIFREVQADNLENSLWLQDRLINIPSSVPV